MKIAFIALSGVRAQSEELTRLGMTLPGFVERSKVIASLPSLSLLTLAGMTPGRIELEYHAVAPRSARVSSPVEVACRITDQTRVGVRSVRACAEAMQYRLTAGRIELEHQPGV